MEVSFYNVFVSVLSMVVLMIPGFILVKTKLLGEKADDVLSTIVLYVLQPALILMGFKGKTFNGRIVVNMLIVAGVSFLVQFGTMLLCFLIVKNKSDKAKQNCIRFASSFGNVGFMGAPFLLALFGGTAFESDVLIYNAIVNCVFNILIWSVGIYLITGDKKNISVKKCLLNPAIVSVAVGVLVFCIVKVPLVDFAEEGSMLDVLITKFMGSINYLSDAVLPISMMLVGMKLAKVPVKKLFLDPWAYYGSFIKLVIASLITILIVAFLPVETSIKYTLFFTLSMPSATSTVLFSVKFGGDSDTASVTVLLSTIISVLTIPLMFLLFRTVVPL